MRYDPRPAWRRTAEALAPAVVGLAAVWVLMGRERDAFRSMVEHRPGTLLLAALLGVLALGLLHRLRRSLPAPFQGLQMVLGPLAGLALLALAFAHLSLGWSMAAMAAAMLAGLADFLLRGRRSRAALEQLGLRLQGKGRERRWVGRLDGSPVVVDVTDPRKAMRVTGNRWAPSAEVWITSSAGGPDPLRWGFIGVPKDIEATQEELAKRIGGDLAAAWGNHHLVAELEGGDLVLGPFPSDPEMVLAILQRLRADRGPTGSR